MEVFDTMPVMRFPWLQVDQRQHSCHVAVNVLVPTFLGTRNELSTELLDILLAGFVRPETTILAGHHNLA